VSGVRFDIHDGIGWMTLDRPDALNALNPPMMDQMRRVVDRAADDAAVSVLVIVGGDKAFSAGADLKYLDEIIDDPARYIAFVRQLNELLFAIEEAPLPTIAMVRGFVLAGGLELMLACDFAFAADDARLGDQHANFGLVPGGGSTQRLVRRLGMQRGKELLFTGCWMDGVRAEEVGLVLRAVPGEELRQRTQEFASQMVPKSKLGLSLIKRAVLHGDGLPMRHAIEKENFAAFEYMTSSQSPRVGLAAFRDRETPEFPE
jgi:enoyl-CoA hydratase